VGSPEVVVPVEPQPQPQPNPIGVAAVELVTAVSARVIELGSTTG